MGGGGVYPSMHPWDGHCHGRYGSYWNAYLSYISLEKWFIFESYFAKINHFRTSEVFGTKTYISWFFSLRSILLFLMLNFGKKERDLLDSLCSRYCGLEAFRSCILSRAVILYVSVYLLMDLFSDFRRHPNLTNKGSLNHSLLGCLTTSVRWSFVSTRPLVHRHVKISVGKWLWKPLVHTKMSKNLENIPSFWYISITFHYCPK